MVEVLQALTQQIDTILTEILQRAKGQGIFNYASSREEEWRASLERLNNSLLSTCQLGSDRSSNLNLVNNCALMDFGVIEAKKYRDRGVTLDMFFMLMKHYKEAYLHVLYQMKATEAKKGALSKWLYQAFDVIETAVVTDWSKLMDAEGLIELQHKNSVLTKDRNRYLTIFESLPIPIILLDHLLQLENLNLKAVELLTEVVKGYLDAKDKGNATDNIFFSMRKIDYSDLFSYDLEGFLNSTSKYNDHFVTRMAYGERSFDYALEVMKCKDMSGRLDGVLILFTLLKEVIHI